MVAVAGTPQGLAQLKRFLRAGMRLDCIHTGWRGDNGQTTRTRMTIAAVQHRGLLLDVPGKGAQLYSPWRKVGCYAFDDEGFTITDPDTGLWVRYEYVID